MSPALNRKYIRCEPLGSNKAWDQVLLPRYLPDDCMPVALLYRDSFHIPDGVVILRPSGYWHYHGGVFRSIDQRKVQAALNQMAWRERQTALGIQTETALTEADRLLDEVDGEEMDQ
ncbi:MAG: hypothetical protein KIS96_14405 [Bauldia sp.]|nr:hypothetical protein [Bauldia sp.]